jgi:hypothetical protein
MARATCGFAVRARTFAEFVVVQTTKFAPSKWNAIGMTRGAPSRRGPTRRNRSVDTTRASASIAVTRIVHGVAGCQWVSLAHGARRATLSPEASDVGYVVAAFVRVFNPVAERGQPSSSPEPAETSYLIDRELGPESEAAFLDDVGVTPEFPYQLVELLDGGLRRMAELVRRYADRRSGATDASSRSPSDYASRGSRRWTAGTSTNSALPMRRSPSLLIEAPAVVCRLRRGCRSRDLRPRRWEGQGRRRRSSALIREGRRL